jgi:two-component system sensor histidine kinase PhoQ
MDEIVAYQLARAAKSGHQTYAAPLTILAHAEEIALMLEKVYARKGALAEFEVDARSVFHGDKGDLMELSAICSATLLWCRGRVLLTARRSSEPRRRPLVASGGRRPGVPEDQISKCCNAGCAATSACRATASDCRSSATS